VLYVRWKKYSLLDGSMQCNICYIYLGKPGLEDMCNLGGCIVNKENWKNLDIRFLTRQGLRGVL
jgi:hypothetical protein